MHISVSALPGSSVSAQCAIAFAVATQCLIFAFAVAIVQTPLFFRPGWCRTDFCQSSCFWQVSTRLFGLKLLFCLGPARVQMLPPQMRAQLPQGGEFVKIIRHTSETMVSVYMHIHDILYIITMNNDCDLYIDEKGVRKRR
jgi:hypothetical protein